MSGFTIRPVNVDDQAWINALIKDQWGAAVVVVHDRLYRPETLRGFVADSASEKLGLITYNIDDAACEIVTLNSLRQNSGVGTALIEAVRQVALTAGCRRLWLITTNDNLHALRFYQKRGFNLSAIYPNAVVKSRTIKPDIPLLGLDDIPIRDEIELEMQL